MSLSTNKWQFESHDNEKKSPRDRVNKHRSWPQTLMVYTCCPNIMSSFAFVPDVLFLTNCYFNCCSRGTAMSLMDSYIICLTSAMVSLVIGKTFCTGSCAGCLLSPLPHPLECQISSGFSHWTSFLFIYTYSIEDFIQTYVCKYYIDNFLISISSPDMNSRYIYPATYLMSTWMFNSYLKFGYPRLSSRPRPRSCSCHGLIFQ